MHRGYIVYEKEEAAQNAFFIEACTDAAARRGIGLRLVFAADLRAMDAPPKGDFALCRCRDAALACFLEGGLRMVNSARLNETANDKRLCFERLGGLVPMLPCYEAAERPPLPLPCVLKSRRGHGGAEVFPAYSEAQYRAAREALAEVPGGAIVQPMAQSGRDTRLYVLGGEVLCAMERTVPAGAFHANVSRGALARRIEPGKAEREICERVQRALPMGYAGVDILYDKDGAPLLNEIEDPVGARMLYKEAGLDVAALLMDYISREILSD